MANRLADKIEDFVLTTASPLDRISPNFTLAELVKSETAARHNIQNWFEDDAYLQSAVYLCRNILQPIRDVLGAFSPNSVYRSQATERALKGMPNTWISSSQHAVGEAADIEIPIFTTLKLAEYIRDNFDYDQIICEMYDPKMEPHSGWVHVSSVRNRKNRKQLLSYVLTDGKYVYVNGLI